MCSADSRAAPTMPGMLRLLLISAITCLIAISSTSARGIPKDATGRSRRANSDQRFGELQALIALSGGGDAAGHGVINPYAAGKKKRADDLVDAPSYSDIEVQKARLLKGMLEELAEQNLI